MKRPGVPVPARGGLKEGMPAGRWRRRVLKRFWILIVVLAVFMVTSLNKVTAELARMNRQVEVLVTTTAQNNFGGYQAVMRDPQTGVYRGASESRKDGMAAGH